MRLLDTLDPGQASETDRLAEAVECRYVRAANTLEPFSFELRLIPPFGHDRVPYAILRLIPDVEISRTLRRLQPLVWTGSKHVATQVADVQIHHAGGVRAIDRRQDPFRTCQRTDLFHGKNHPCHRGDVAYKDDSRAQRERVIDPVHDIRRRLYRFGQLEFLDHHTVALRAQVPWMLSARVLLVAHQDFVPRLHVDAVGDVAVRLRRIPNERELIAVATHEFRQGITKLIPRAISPDRI